MTESFTVSDIIFSLKLFFGHASVFPVRKIMVEGDAVFEEITSFLLLCSFVGVCHLSRVLDFCQPFELIVSSNLSSLGQMWLSNLQPLLQLLTSGRKTGLKVGVKVFLTAPAGFGRACLVMP